MQILGALTCKFREFSCKTSMYFNEQKYSIEMCWF